MTASLPWSWTSKASWNSKLPSSIYSCGEAREQSLLYCLSSTSDTVVLDDTLPVIEELKVGRIVFYLKER
jgi:hypothetical protein